MLHVRHANDHRPDLPHITMALTTLDPCGVPLASDVLAGEQADDPISVPVMAQREEMLVEIVFNKGDRTVCWQERRRIIPSIDGSLAAQICMHERQEKAIGELRVRTHGTPQLTSQIQVEEHVPSILSSWHVEGVLQALIQEEVAEQPVRVSRGKRSSSRQI